MLRSFSSKRNKTVRITCVGFGLLLAVLTTAVKGEELTPTGLWRTVDDKTGKPKGIVRIYEEKGRLFGRVERSIDPADEKEKCEKCPGDRKNKPVIGLVVLRDMEKRGDEYGGGDILDPDSGWVYRCKLRLIEKGKKLEVRGFIGLSLLGRNQIWTREQ